MASKIGDELLIGWALAHRLTTPFFAFRSIVRSMG